MADEDKFINNVITGDEMWCFVYDLQKKKVVFWMEITTTS